MKFTLVCPAGSVTVAGTVRWVVPLELNATLMFCDGAALEVIVPVTVPPFSGRWRAGLR